MTHQQVVTRVQVLRSAGYTLSQISERIIEECLEDGRRPSNDNLTLMIVDLAAFYNESTRQKLASPK